MAVRSRRNRADDPAGTPDRLLVIDHRPIGISFAARPRDIVHRKLKQRVCTAFYSPPDPP
jgi:hypothetical protein